MRRILKVLYLFIVITMPLVAVAQTVDPCTQNTPLTGGTLVQLSSSKTDLSGYISGTPYHYEVYAYSVGQNANIMYYGNQGGGAAYKAEWTNPNDYLGRVGYYWGTGGPYTQYKNIYCDFNYTRSGQGTGGNYSYIGIYGWTKNPLVEYYIVDDWFGNDNSPVTIATTGGQIVGSFTVDGAIYDVIENTRINQPSILGTTTTFTQIFSVRRTPRKCGTISVTEHFKEWTDNLKLPFGNQMYECSFLTEAGGGTGWLDASYLSFSQEDEPRESLTGNELILNNTLPKLHVNVLSGSDVNVNFTATGNGETELRLYNLTGSLIASTNLQTITGKNYSYTFNQGKLPSGVYVVQMNSNGNLEQTKVIIPE